MKIPKLKFTQIPLELEIDMFYNFLFKSDWKKYIIEVHPQIGEVLGIKGKEKQVSFIENYLKCFRKEQKKKIESNREVYLENWQKIEKDFLMVLSEIMEETWPKNRKIINAQLSSNPICPRFLDKWSFSIFYNYDKKSRSNKVIAHEVCHFLYFEKWKRMYPKMDVKRFENPYIEWHLSEVLTPVILNDHRIKKLLGEKSYGYEEYESIKINGKTVPIFF